MLIFDIETNGLLDDVSKLHCMCIKDTRHLPQIEQPEGFAEQLDILFSAE